jgi:hypothetical protein
MYRLAELNPHIVANKHIDPAVSTLDERNKNGYRVTYAKNNETGEYDQAVRLLRKTKKRNIDFFGGHSKRSPICSDFRLSFNHEESFDVTKVNYFFPDKGGQVKFSNDARNR